MVNFISVQAVAKMNENDNNNKGTNYTGGPTVITMFSSTTAKYFATNN